MPRRRTGAASVDAADPPDERRTIRRRSPLPNGRAVAGGFLVSVAALGVAGAHLQAGASPGRPYVLTVRAVAPGTVIQPDDLRVAIMDLPGPLAGGAFGDLEQVQGSVALGPIGAGELVQATSVLPPDEQRRPPAPELSVSLERDQAVDGGLVPGESVDLLATYGTGDAAYTQTVAREATVRTIRGGDDGGGFASSGLVTLTLALADRADLLAAAHAAHTDALTLVRTTGTSAEADADAYRPTPPTAPAEVDTPTAAGSTADAAGTTR